ncbi:MAG: M28 family metallopeptidase [Xanthomonadaceae bacterium]|nr:M28 family metallopeptidase [Xanthomonadaceae bacterium]
MLRNTTALLCAALLLTACDPTPTQGNPAALQLINAERMHDHISVLASDEFEGRAPSSRGEELTVAYLSEQLRELGVIPGNGSSFTQRVPLVAITGEPSPLRIQGGDGEPMVLQHREDAVLWTRRVIERAGIADSELVFVGYGIVAPEYGWNDYDGIDVEGKTVVMLVNDPGFATGDDALFTGRAMTYYGRWTYKYEEAARQGAAGALIIHETEPASYPWEVVTGSWTGAQFGMITEDMNMSRAAIEGWITAGAARELFERAGSSLDEMKHAAQTRGFQPVALGLNATASVTNTTRESVTQNVIGMIRGDQNPDEYVIYTAHWDHLGRDGDDIYNGAVDNASGTAALLVLAEAYAALERPPARTVVFLAVGAEEQGLLGSAYYAANPVLPLADTVAVINMDALNYIGPTRDITVVGYGASELDRYVDEVAEEFKREVKPDQRPEAGIYYRSDHFSFAKTGVPALYPNMGRDLVNGGRERGMQLASEYNAERYHKPADKYSPDMDWTGAAADVQMFFEIGRRIADSSDWPNWVEGNEFRMARDQQRSETGSVR